MDSSSNNSSIESDLRQIFKPETLLAVYNIKHPWAKGETPDGAGIGNHYWRPKTSETKAFYDLVFRSVLQPLSGYPLDALQAIDFTSFLPSPDAPDYPEQTLGLITILDQQRILLSGYGKRYTAAFFDVLCLKLVQQLLELPEGKRPHSKHAWLSRGYTFEDWLARTLWLWTPFVHSDSVMVHHRSFVKDWVHSMRAAVESHFNKKDPYAPLEPADDLDITLFQKMIKSGPPLLSPGTEQPASIADYSFWWIRIINAHFSISDMCGHYPYVIRFRGELWTEKDREFLDKTEGFWYHPEEEPTLKAIRKDFLRGVWSPLEGNPEFEDDGKVPEETLARPVSVKSIDLNLKS